MAEKVKKLNLHRDYKKYLYFLHGEGRVCQKDKSGKGGSKSSSKMPFRATINVSTSLPRMAM